MLPCLIQGQIIPVGTFPTENIFPFYKRGQFIRDVWDEERRCGTTRQDKHEEVHHYEYSGSILEI